jgi:hypothetical protein
MPGQETPLPLLLSFHRAPPANGSVIRGLIRGSDQLHMPETAASCILGGRREMQGHDALSTAAL